MKLKNIKNTAIAILAAVCLMACGKVREDAELEVNDQTELMATKDTAEVKISPEPLPTDAASKPAFVINENEVKVTEPEDAPEISTPTATPTETPTPTEEPTETPTAVPTEEPKATATPVPTLPPVQKDASINDTVAPFFLYYQTAVTLQKGSAFDVHNYVAYIDDLDSDVTLDVAGAPDMNTAGTYNMTLRISDDAGNTATHKMTVEVINNAPAIIPYVPLPGKTFDEFIKKYKTDDNVVGIDVSKWQGTIDFNKVAAAGAEFVIIRIGGYSGGLFTDGTFKANLQNAKAAGLKVGIYWYSEENGAEQVRANANHLYSLLGGESLDFPIFFDWEDYTHFENYKMSIKDLNEMFLAFCDEAESRGYTASLYNSKNFLNLLWSQEAKNKGVWLAHYVNETDYTGSYFLWQQGIANIDGIYGDVDVDVYYPNKQ